MPDTDLSHSIRAVVDAVPPVSAAEAVALAERSRPAARGGARSIAASPGHAPLRSGGRGRATVLATASAVFAGILVAALVVTAGHGPGRSGATRPGHAAAAAPTSLSAAAIRQISAETLAASRTSTATLTESVTRTGALQSRSQLEFVFAEDNVQLGGTVTNWDPPGSGRAATSRDYERLVDGQTYMYMTGPEGLRWYQLSTPSGRLDGTPDLRQLFGVLAAGAGLEAVSRSGDLTQLRAATPGDVATTDLRMLADGRVMSLDVWVDTRDVVQRIDFTAIQTHPSCTLAVPTSWAVSGSRTSWQQALLDSAQEAIEAQSPSSVSIVPSHVPSPRVSCVDLVQTVAVAFSAFGNPESVVTPPGAVTLGAGRGEGRG